MKDHLDDDGKPIIGGDKKPVQVFDFGDREDAAGVALGELLGMTVEIPIHQINMDSMPDDISAGQLSGIWQLIKDESNDDANPP